MKKTFQFCSMLSFLLLILAGCHNTKQITNTATNKYIPDDQNLYDTIVKLDSIFFGFYNTCETNLDKYAAFYSDSIEFYHDQGGLMTSKAELVEATKKNICGKVTRHLVKGSIEVYPIKGFGAVEMASHFFKNNQEEQPATPKIGRLVIIWQHTINGWKISRAISLH
jgi:hypothetical protein